jgi:orotate phosphoribosyltransferase
MTGGRSFRGRPGLYTTRSARPDGPANGHRPCHFRTLLVTHDQVLQLFRRSGALLEGHFRLTSGLHSPGYLQSALVLQHPRDAQALAEAIAPAVAALAPTAVLSPALGGIVIGHEVARALGVRALFAERQDGRLTLRRGFTLDASDRVLVVEDVVTTGGSTRETIEVATAAGATVVGAAAIVDRNAARGDLGVPFHALLRISLPTYDPSTCPLCAEGVPVVKPGSREVRSAT